jgi:glycosyltransferase involved in cell wall biosynthesis
MHSPARQRPAERSLPLSQRTYLAFLGRISPEKGLDTADWEHYRRDVRPLLEQDHTQLLSEVDDRAKDQFLGQAAALLFPIRWPEPFGWS